MLIFFNLFLVACAAVGVAFVLFRQRILFRIQEAVHLISNLWLELVIIVSCRIPNWFDCKRCAIYGTSQHDKSCLSLSKSFLFIPYASRCSRFQKQEGRGEGKGKPEGDREKKYEDYAWKDVSQDPTKLIKLRVPELNKYLKHPRLENHLTRHLLLQMNPEGTDLLQTRLRETETKLKMNLCQTVITTIVMKTTTVEAKAAVMRRMKMIALTLVIETVEWCHSCSHR